MTIFNTLESHTLEREQYREHWISLTQDTSETRNLVLSIPELLNAYKADAVSIRLLGSQQDLETGAASLQLKSSNVACPPTLLKQDRQNGPTSLDVQIHAVSGANTKPLYLGDTCVGKSFEDNDVKYYMINVLPEDPQTNPYMQTKSVFEKAQLILSSFGLDFSHTIRTWLFARDILSWYDELNQARNEFFEMHHIYDRLVPASTGIGISNPTDSILTVQLLAVEAKNSNVVIGTAPSPLQGPAMEYKSSFSRAVKVLCPDYSRLYISGTASVDKTGATVFIEDINSQIDLTMRIVKGILDKAGMDWGEVVSSLAYFKYREDFRLFDDYCQKHQIRIPHIKVHADICRDDLLFELELDSVKAV